MLVLVQKDKIAPQFTLDLLVSNDYYRNSKISSRIPESRRNPRNFTGSSGIPKDSQESRSNLGISIGIHEFLKSYTETLENFPDPNGFQESQNLVQYFLSD